MPLIAVASCKGAPGATTAALALGAVWPRSVLVAELDPFGGDLAARFNLFVTPGLVTLAAAAGTGEASVADHCQQLPGGLPVLAGPESWQQAAVAVPAVVALLASLPDVDVVADCGRLVPGSPAAPAVAAS